MQHGIVQPVVLHIHYVFSFEINFVCYMLKSPLLMSFKCHSLVTPLWMELTPGAATVCEFVEVHMSMHPTWYCYQWYFHPTPTLCPPHLSLSILPTSLAAGYLFICFCTFVLTRVSHSWNPKMQIYMLFIPICYMSSSFLPGFSSIGGLSLFNSYIVNSNGDEAWRISE